MKKLMILLLIVVLVVGCNSKAPAPTKPADVPAATEALDVDPEATGTISLDIIPKDPEMEEEPVEEDEEPLI